MLKLIAKWWRWLAVIDEPEPDYWQEQPCDDQQELRRRIPDDNFSFERLKP